MALAGRATLGATCGRALTSSEAAAFRLLGNGGRPSDDVVGRGRSIADDGRVDNDRTVSRARGGAAVAELGLRFVGGHWDSTDMDTNVALGRSPP